MEKNLVLVEYQKNFADNLSSYALAKINENQTGEHFYYENSPILRNNFENKMSYFQIDCNFLSTNRIQELAKNACEFHRVKTNLPVQNHNKIIKRCKFKFSDIQYIDDEIIKSLCFKNTDFILNYDILEEITKTNSIGLYINHEDYKQNLVDFKFIRVAAKRLNKYIKQPKLYIFTSVKFENKLNLDIPYKIFNLENWREEFYFLMSCKHKIHLNAKNSYSICLWAGILNKNNYNYFIYDKNLKGKNLPKNWIGI